MPNLFAHAASLLLAVMRCRIQPGPAQSEAVSLLRELDYPIEDCPETRAPRPAVASGFAFLACFRTGRSRRAGPGLFSGPSSIPRSPIPCTPAVLLVGVSGVGLSPQEAFQSCIGEGIEYASQLQTAEDALVRLASVAIPRQSLVGGRGNSSRPFLSTGCVPRLNFRGAVRAG